MFGNPPILPPEHHDGRSSNSDNHSLRAAAAASGQSIEHALRNFKKNLADICFVDSGVGGAMAAKLVPGFTVEFGSNVCLPIGDKTRELITT